MRVETIGDATLYLGDCAEILPTLQVVDAVITDPPYGISADRQMSRRGGQKNGKSLARGALYSDHGWDADPIPDELMRSVISAGRSVVIFGGNFYAMPAASCWLVWDKENGNNDYADCELAWTNLPKAVRRIRYMWHGMLRANGEPRGDHPTQKPIGVMSWAIGHLPGPCETILDPFMGSGTTGVAAIQLGRKFIGIERELKYFDIACRRIEQAVAQGKLFTPEPPRHDQMTLA